MDFFARSCLAFNEQLLPNIHPFCKAEITSEKLSLQTKDVLLLLCRKNVDAVNRYGVAVVLHFPATIVLFDSFLRKILRHRRENLREKKMNFFTLKIASWDFFQMWEEKRKDGSEDRSKRNLVEKNCLVKFF